ncbi:PilZ domain protein [Phycisphaerae bacterium RAS1]|nr:PilZ domain protein [Phycisphaerae bacterium RAS1]
MSVAELPSYSDVDLSAVPLTMERRTEARVFACGDLFLVDHAGGTVFPCHCLDVSGHGMRLRAPLGYGIAEGQRYELCSHLPGSRPSAGFGLAGSRWVTVVRSQIAVDTEHDALEVGVAFDPKPTVYQYLGS